MVGLQQGRMERGMNVLHGWRKIQTVGGPVARDDPEWSNEAGLQLPGGEALQPQVGCRQEHVLTYEEWGRVAFFVSL